MERCTMTTKAARQCKRAAVVRYYLRGVLVASYCAQHDRAESGPARLLHIAPWEYDARYVSPHLVTTSGKGFATGVNL